MRNIFYLKKRDELGGTKKKTKKTWKYRRVEYRGVKVGRIKIIALVARVSNTGEVKGNLPIKGIIYAQYHHLFRRSGKYK